MEELILILPLIRSQNELAMNCYNQDQDFNKEDVSPFDDGCQDFVASEIYQGLWAIEDEEELMVA